jgi:hypothetical protein
MLDVITVAMVMLLWDFEYYDIIFIKARAVPLHTMNAAGGEEV